MKRHISLLMAVVMVLSLFAFSSCGDAAPSDGLDMVERALDNLKANGADFKISFNITVKMYSVNSNMSTNIFVKMRGLDGGRLTDDTEIYVRADLGGIYSIGSMSKKEAFAEIALSHGILYTRTMLPSYIGSDDYKTETAKADISGYFDTINEAIDSFSSGETPDKTDGDSEFSRIMSAVTGAADGLKDILSGLAVRSDPGGYSVSYSVTEEDVEKLKEDLISLLGSASDHETDDGIYGGIADAMNDLGDMFNVDAFMYDISTDKKINFKSAALNWKVSVEDEIKLEIGGSVKVTFTDPGREPSVTMPEGYEDYPETPAEEVMGTVKALSDFLGTGK